MEMHFDELIEKKMGSGIKVEKDNFKSIVKKFTNRWQTMANEIEDMVKIY